MSSTEVLIDSVSISFGKRDVLQNFSAVFEPASVGALVGPSGSGKSSLLSAIGGLLGLKSGSITYRNVTTGTLSTPQSGSVAWVPQGANCLSARSAVDNVMLAPLSEGFGIDRARSVAMEALGRVGLSERHQALARVLSGGELQRLSFARALASTKRVILADEPTSNLDAQNTEIIADLLRSLSIDATVIVATHDPLIIDSAAYSVDIRERANAKG